MIFTQKEDAGQRTSYLLLLNFYFDLNQKIRHETPEPKFLLSENEGGKKPDLLSTVGSGWDK